MTVDPEDKAESADAQDQPRDVTVEPADPQAWVPGDVPDAIAPPPSLEELADDVEAAWRPKAGARTSGDAPRDADGTFGVADTVALVAVGMAALVLVLWVMVPMGRRLSELPGAGVADPGVAPALFVLACVLLLSVAVFGWVLSPWARQGRPVAAPHRHRLLAWAWAAVVLVLASARVTGSFPVFGDPLVGAIEYSPSGSVLGLDVPKAVAIGLIWACLYALVVAPVLALVFARLAARGRLDGVELVLTRSGPVLLKGGPTPAVTAPDDEVPDEVPDDEAT